MKTLNIFSFALVTSVALMGCIEPEEDDPNIGSASEEVWTIGGSVSWVEWNSGVTSNLSGWQDITCTTTYGDDYMLTHLEAFKEPWTNADNFIAKLKGSCTRYDVVGGVYEQVGNSSTETIFSANHRTPGTKVGAADERYPIGMTVVKDWGNDYLKNLEMLSVEELGNGVLGSYANPFKSAVALSGLGHFTGPWVDVACPDQQVMTGLKLKYSTNNGKIRRLRIFCRRLWDN